MLIQILVEWQGKLIGQKRISEELSDDLAESLLGVILAARARQGDVKDPEGYVQACLARGVLTGFRSAARKLIDATNVDTISPKNDIDGLTPDELDTLVKNFVEQKYQGAFDRAPREHWLTNSKSRELLIAARRNQLERLAPCR